MKKLRSFGAASACLFAFGLSTSTNAAVTAYAQDFEGLDALNSGVLGSSGEGFVVWGDVWDGDVGTTLLYSYGPFSAPNGDWNGFSAIVIGDGTDLLRGNQHLNIFSDYENFDQGEFGPYQCINGCTINTSVFQEQVIDSGDVDGGTWTLTFDALANPDFNIGDPASNATASAFIKTIDPNNGYVTNDIHVDTTGVLPDAWGSYSISLALSDPLLAGQLLQFGFNTTASNYENSGVFYDNICFDNAGGCPTSPVPVPAAIWLFGSGLLGLVGMARRKKAA